MKKRISAIIMAMLSLTTAITLSSCGKSSSSENVIPVTSIAIKGSGVDNNAVSLTIGQEVLLQATVKPNEATDKQVIWSSENAAIASISSVGVLKGLTPGSTTIQAAAGGFTQSLAVSVVNYIPITEIRFSNDTFSMQKGTRSQLNYTVLPEEATEKSLVFSIIPSDSGVTVSSTGMVEISNDVDPSISFTVVAHGYNETNVTASCVISIEVVALESVAIVENDFSTPITSIVVPVNEPYRVLFVHAVPDKAVWESITYTSSDETIVKANAKGRLTFYSIGQANVTICVNNSLQFTYVIPVSVIAASADFIGNYYMPSQYVSRISILAAPADLGWQPLADFRDGGTSAPSAKKFVLGNYKYFTGPSSWFAGGGYCIEMGGWDNIDSGLEDDDLPGGGMANLYMWAKVAFGPEASKIRAHFEYRATDATFKYKLRLTMIDLATSEIVPLTDWQSNSYATDPNLSANETYIEAPLPERFRGQTNIMLLEYDDIDFPTDGITNGVDSVNIKYFTVLNSNGETVDNAFEVIGDSIMTTEFTQTMVQDIADGIGATLFRDTISGSTIAPASSIGIVDHIDNNTYKSNIEEYGAPKIIAIQRGSNDLYWSGVSGNPLQLGSPESTDKTTTYGAIRYTIEYFKSVCPEARIVWSTVFYRNDVADSRVIEFNANLSAICASYGVEVLDLYTLTGFNSSNYATYLVDGIHPNSQGKQVLKDLWISCLNK